MRTYRQRTSVDLEAMMACCRETCAEAHLLKAAVQRKCHSILQFCCWRSLLALCKTTKQGLQANACKQMATSRGQEGGDARSRIGSQLESRCDRGSVGAPASTQTGQSLPCAAHFGVHECFACKVEAAPPVDEATIPLHVPYPFCSVCKY